MANGYSRFKYKLNSGQNASLLIWSDSTGYYSSNPRCWPFLFLDYLATQYPTHNIILQQWNSGTGLYTQSTFRAGVGPTITLWLCASVGWAIWYWVASYWQYLIKEVDGIIINLGHIGAAAPQSMIQGELFNGVESLRLTHSRVPISVTTQNKWQNRNDYAIVDEAWRRVSQYSDCGLIDAYSLFQNDSANLWTDFLHPNQNGQDGWSGLNIQHFVNAPEVSSYEKESALLYGSSLIDPEPYNWTAVNCTKALDKTFYDPIYGFSTKLSGTTKGWIEQSVDLDDVRNKVVSLAARTYLPSGGNSTLRIASLVVDGTEYKTRYASGQAYWTWWSVAGVTIPDSASSVSVRLYREEASSSPQNKDVWVDNIGLCLGHVPCAGKKKLIATTAN